jgi:hypothetical protein
VLASQASGVCQHVEGVGAILDFCFRTKPDLTRTRLNRRS